MNKTKIAVLIVIAVSVIIVLYYFFGSQPKAKPQFEIVSFQGSYDLIYGTYDTSFQLRNSGNGTASLIYGTIKFGNSSSIANWGIIPAETVLYPDETSQWISAQLMGKHTATYVTIVVECAERGPQELIQSLST